MIKVFDKNNLTETLSKKPIILYHSEKGACGPSGLFFAIFDDRSLYAYSNLYDKSDKELIHSIIEYVPEFRMLFGSNDTHHFKRDRINENYEEVYLGLGNCCFITEEYLKKMNEYKDEFIYSSFKRLVQEIVGDNINHLFDLVEKTING